MVFRIRFAAGKSWANSSGEQRKIPTESVVEQQFGGNAHLQFYRRVIRKQPFGSSICGTRSPELRRRHLCGYTLGAVEGRDIAQYSRKSAQSTQLSMGVR